MKIEKFKKLLKDKGLNALLISSVSNIIYLTNYSGFSNVEREAYIFITEQKNYIITDPRYSEAINQIQGFELLEISHKNKLEDIFKKFKHFAIGFEDYDLKVSEFKRFKKIFKRLTPIDLGQIRIIKSDEEIKKIEKACKIGDEAFEYILGKIKPGMSEKDVALELELFIRKKGASLSFDTIVAFGKNSATPHHLTGDQRLETNDMILMDFGVKKDNYCSDMTRVVFIGNTTPIQKKAYQTVLEANKRAIEFLKNQLVYSSSEEQRDESRSFHNNITIQQFNNSSDNSRLQFTLSKSKGTNNKIPAKDVDKVARDYIISQGFPSIPHSLGHGVGIEIHESPHLSPKSKEILENGMVFSIEPGIYIPKENSGKSGWGGIRIEDLVTIQDNQLKILTKSPKDLMIL